MPAAIGQTSYFRLDSGIISLSSNTKPVINEYLLKEVVSGIEYDNNNHPVWRVERYLNKDLSGNGNWVPNGYYHIAYFDDRIEVVENSLRFIKLVRPVRAGYSWKGNSYLPDKPYEQYKVLFDFPSIQANMRNWNYSYTSVNKRESIQNLPDIDSVTTVEQINVSTFLPDDFELGSSQQISGNYASRELSVEKYAGGIGLVLREQSLWEYQIFNTTTTEIRGFYLKMWRVNQ